MIKSQTLAMVLAVVSPLATCAAGPFDENLPRISWEKAADHYGQRCIVYGTVVATRDIGRRCFLNFHPNFQENFTVVVNQESYANFPETPDKVYLGKHVRVVGDVVEFRGKPEIVITSPEEIEIIEDPTPPAGDAPSAPTPSTPAPTASPPPPPPPPAPPSPAPPAPAPQRSAPAADGVVTIATYNVLNLFDDFDDPYVENEYLPGKKIGELEALAGTIHRLDADVLALQEVENRPALEAFVEKHLSDMGYGEVVLFEGNSDRGIDVALLSRLPVGPVTSHRHLEFPDGNGKSMRFQRDLLQVRLEPPGHQPFDLFVVHLKSKYGGDEVALPIRMGEAKTIRRLFDEILAAHPEAPFAICGDFNDTFESQPVQTILGAGPTALRSFVEDLPADGRITYNKEPYRSMIDFIFASPGMAAGYQAGSYQVLLGSVESSGSDHNPLKARFQMPPGRSGN